MRFNYKKFKYMYSLTAIAIALFFIFAIASPVTAETYINPGLSWEAADLRCYWLDGSQNYYNVYQNSDPHNREEFSTDSVRSLRHIIFNLYYPSFEVDQPMLMFSITGVSVNNFLTNDGHIPTCYIENGNGQDFKMKILDYKYDDHDNEHAYIYNLGDNGMMVFVPASYFFIRASGGYVAGAPFINLQLGAGSNNYFCRRTSVLVCLTYIGAIDNNNTNYTSILNSILSTSLNIETKMDTIINLLNNQQSQQQASQSINSAETVHNNIDQIQNSSGTALSNSFNSFLNNPDLTLNTSTISGASFLATLATSIFNNVGIFNWLFIFPAFIGLGTYLIGRGSKVLK